ncbi:MAG: TIR domain-containing protein [Clostridiales bacterium]|nr:TIR domain-containing protein [Clostridiales bacterium]
MASRARFPVYRGENPYIFISYAHADSAVVLPIAEELHKRHYRVWYDEGIEAGARWPEYIATHLLNAGTALFFPSERFNVNRNCEREVNFAVDAKKPMACVGLDDSQMPPGMKMQLSTAAYIRAGENPADAADRLIQSGALGPELIGDGVEGYEATGGGVTPRANAALIVGVVGILLAVIFGVALLGYMKGWIGPGTGPTSTIVVMTPGVSGGETQTVEVTKWSGEVMRDLIISQTSGQALYCCGNAFVSDRTGIEYRDGSFRIAGETVARGDIADLDAISRLTGLVELALCYESVTDVSALQTLTGLTYLDLSGNEIKDISSLSSLSSLATLKLSHTNVTDLSPALNLPVLKKLYVSYDMIDDARDILTGNFDVIVTQ